MRGGVCTHGQPKAQSRKGRLNHLAKSLFSGTYNELTNDGRTAMTRHVELVVHTTSGLEFETVDVRTKESSGRMAWWGSDDEQEGVDYHTKKITDLGWTLTAIVWS
jgi:hypothetical protein